MKKMPEPYKRLPLKPVHENMQIRSGTQYHDRYEPRYWSNTSRDCLMILSRAWNSAHIQLRIQLLQAQDLRTSWQQERFCDLTRHRHSLLWPKHFSRLFDHSYCTVFVKRTREVFEAHNYRNSVVERSRERFLDIFRDRLGDSYEPI
jgi:hypothetical protein